jgi:hypothetical protein
MTSLSALVIKGGGLVEVFVNKVDNFKVIHKDI